MSNLCVDWTFNTGSNTYQKTRKWANGMDRLCRLTRFTVISTSLRGMQPTAASGAADSATCLWLCNTIATRCTCCSTNCLKVKVHTLDIAPLRSESPPQKRSGITRVLKGFHSFTCKLTRSSAIGMSHTCLCLPSRSWYSFTDPGGMEGWVDLGAK